MQNLSLRDVRQGMKVYDSANHEIGTVDWVKMGEDDPDTPAVESASPPAEPDANGGLITAVAEAFHPEDLPAELQEKLLQDGFIRIDSKGLFASDRYVTPDQIAAIEADSIVLSVDKDQLVKRD